MTKVLYLSGAKGADYQADMLFHGLRSLLGPDCVDVNKLTYMYQGEPYPPFYTVYGLLPDIEVDREDISGKLEARYFDAVIYGSIQRFSEHLSGVQRLYPPERIAYIDGEDDWTVVDVGLGQYFKREIADHHPLSILPIEFCIPKEKIRELGPKTRLMAPCDPRDRTTYQFYGDESKYYDQYSESYFGYTMRKGGWDCCRHYEIMAAGCLPYFENIEACPSRTMFRLPKDLLLRSRNLCDQWKGSIDDEADYRFFARDIREILRTQLTTEAMAKYVLSKVTQ